MLQRAIELSPDHAEAHHLLAFVYGDLGRHNEARTAAKRAVEINPAYEQAQANLSLERLAGRRESASYESLDESIVTEGEGTLAHYNLGLAFRQQGYHQEALREYRLGLDLGEDRELLRNAIAEVYLVQGELDAALELYDSLVAESSGSGKLWNEHGVALHLFGRSDDALVSFCNALEQQPDYVLASNNAAVALAQVGRNKEALKAFDETLRIDPSLVVARLNLGLLLFKLQQYQSAMEAYRLVLQGEDNAAVAWNGVGLVLNELGRQTDARNAFARAVEADPKLAEAHYNLSFALSGLGDYDGALHAVTRAQTLDPYYVPQKFRFAIDLQYEDPTIAVIPEISADVSAESAPAIDFDQEIIDGLFAELDRPVMERPSVTQSDPLALARDYLNKGLLDLALADIDRVARRGVDSVEMQILSAQIHARRGLHGEALERFRAARLLDPQRIDARLGEVRQLLSLGRGSEAEDDITALAEAYPDDVDVLVALAEVRLASGDPANALDSLRIARGRAPQRADILKLEGDVAVDMGDLESAQKAYGDALELDPKYAQVQMDLGKIHEARKDWVAAESSYRAALDSLPTFSDAGLALARVYRRADKPRTAVNILVEMLSNDPSDLEALVALGQCLLDDRRAEEAIQAFGRVLAFDDGSEFRLQADPQRQLCSDPPFSLRYAITARCRCACCHSNISRGKRSTWIRSAKRLRKPRWKAIRR